MQSKNVIGTILIVGALTALVTTSMRSNTLRSIPVSELRAADATQKSLIGQTLRVVGTVGAEKVRRVPVNTDRGVVNVNYFVVHENNRALQVEYRNALPDTFRPGGQVQVDGQYTAPGKMVAEHVFTKCPSKYDNGKAGKDGKVSHPSIEGKANPHAEA